MRAVVLVHGFGSDADATWTDFAAALGTHDELRGWRIIPFEYPTKKIRIPFDDLTPGIEVVSQGLRTFLRFSDGCRDAREIVVLGHSMGGLIVRKYLVEEVKAARLPLKIRSALMYATPNTGAEVARLSDLLSKNNKQAEQLRPNSEFIKQLNADWSKMKVQEHADVRFVVAAQDQVVEEDSARLHWDDEYLEVLIDRDHRTVVQPVDGDNDLAVLVALGAVQKVGSTTGGRLIDPYLLIEQFQSRFEEVDADLARIIPRGLVSPRAENQPRPFSGEKLVTSLVALGMPVRIAIQIMEGVYQQLMAAAPERLEVYTRDLRRFVFKAIQGLVGQGVGDTAVDEWLTGYARRYGTPSARLMVVRGDERFPLDYSFLMGTLTPDLIRCITGVELADVSTELITRGTVRAMASTMLEAVNGMQLHAVTYETLLDLASDIALRPPHPWLVQSAGLSEVVSYDLERATQLVDQAKTLDAEEDYAELRYAVTEGIHHSVSAILGYYGAFLGAGKLAPIHQLHTHLRRDFKLLSWDYCRISDLPRDLEEIGERRHHFQKDMNWIVKRINNITRPKLEVWPSKAAWIRNIACALVERSARATAAGA